MKFGGHLPNEHLFSDTLSIMSEFKLSAGQVFLCTGRAPYPSREYKNEVVYKEMKRLFDEKQYHMYAHAIYNILLRPEMSKRDFSYVQEHLKAASRLGLKGVVIHTAGRLIENDTDNSIAAVAGNIEKMIKDLGPEWSMDTKLLIETSAGSKSDSRYGSFKDLNEICNLVNDPRVGICVDTAHCFANGIALKDLMNENWTHVSLCHFNSPDKNVTLGSHLDRHEGGFESEVFSPADVFDFASFLQKRPIDIIFEREHLGTIHKDLRTYFSNTVDSF